MEKRCRALNKNERKLTKQKSENRFQLNINKTVTISKNDFDFIWKNPTQNSGFYVLTNRDVIMIKSSNESEKFVTSDPSQNNQVFWKNKENETLDCEMWTFRTKSRSLKRKNFRNSNDEKKIFRKNSKPLFPSCVSERSKNLLQSRNMLWRPLQHLQKFCEEKYINMQQISEVFNTELQKIAQNNSLQVVSDCLFNKTNVNETAGRKTRLSRWTFLGHKQEGLNRNRSTSKFPIQKQFSLKFRTQCCDYHCKKYLSSNKSLSSDENSNCSCKKCADDLNEDLSQEVTEQFRKINMAPNSEEDSKMVFSNKRGWATELAEKEPLRPPVYNPEDYATSLKKWGKKGSIGIQLPQYLSQSTGSLEKFSEELSHRSKRQSSPSTKSSSSIKSGDEKQSKKERETTLKIEKKDVKNKENINRGLKNDMQKDFLSPILSLSSQTGEMSLRQFSSVTELLGKLKVDLKLSFPSFVQEFVGDPIDGVTLLLELLRSVQFSQTAQLQKCPPQILRRSLLDEHSCLVCLKYCLRCSDASRRLASSPAGLFTLAVCIMSNVTQSRILALELLTKACEPDAGGHKAVSEALSTLRLRFGEPVRFRFLVGMLSSAGAIDLLAAAMSFINVFVESAPNLQQKVYIQAELEQAGFDSETLRKSLPSNSERVKIELNKWEKNYFDVEKLRNKVAEANTLHEKINLLEKRIQILQEEKGILQSLEQCLKERCSELEEEVSINTNTTSKLSPTKPFRNCALQQKRRSTDKEESTPAEDEGISSSEQELSQDEDYVKGEISYNPSSNHHKKITNLNKNKSAKQSGSELDRYLDKISGDNGHCKLKNLKNISTNKLKETNVDDGNEIIPIHGERDEEEEEETTIDEVIEELENIVNDAETEVYANDEKVNILDMRTSVSFTESPEKMTLEEKCQTYSNQSLSLLEKNNFEEARIIPAILHPQPPKKAKSLIHIYFPGSDFDSQDRNKSEFFEDDTDTESSDSLLTNTREKKTRVKSSRNSLEVSESFNSLSSVNTRSFFISQEQDLENCELNPRLGYEERNIDEEEIRRKQLKLNSASKRENIQTEFSDVFYKTKKLVAQNNEIRKDSKEKLNGFDNTYEKETFIKTAKNFPGRISNESPLSRVPKFAPAPVKRSQTFHITTSDGDNPHKKSEVKPKPKMGVSGLDFQRASEFKTKNEHWKCQIFDYKQSLERRADMNDKYSKKITKTSQNIQSDEKSDVSKTLRKDNSSGSFAAVTGVCRSDSFSVLDKSFIKPRSKSVEKIDEGLDSLVDIVISTDETRKPKPKNEWNAEVGKNIGPRTRRSLAESSLFCPQYLKNTNKLEETQKPPKPAQRTSLTKNNSSSIPMHLPMEVKLAPVQVKQHQPIIYNFGLKSAKSAESLLASCQAKRCPPDGSSSPIGFKKNQENQKFTDEKPNPLKPTKIQTFFGNPKFENSQSNELRVNHKYFENNYSPVTREKSNDRCPQTEQSSQEKFKNQILHFNQQKITTSGHKPPEVKDNPTHSKPNFLLGTYQSQISTNNITKPKISGLVLQSINTFNNNSFVNNGYSGGKKNTTQSNFPTKEKSTKMSGRPGNSMTSTLEKVTDSPSGLY